jgi:hypothetical protein
MSRWTVMNSTRRMPVADPVADEVAETGQAAIVRLAGGVAEVVPERIYATERLLGRHRPVEDALMCVRDDGACVYVEFTPRHPGGTVGRSRARRGAGMSDDQAVTVIFGKCRHFWRQRSSLSRQVTIQLRQSAIEWAGSTPFCSACAEKVNQGNPRFIAKTVFDPSTGKGDIVHVITGEPLYDDPPPGRWFR